MSGRSVRGLPLLGLLVLGGCLYPVHEKIDASFGSIRTEPLHVIHRRLVEADPGRGCQQCWTACRGFAQALGEGGSFGAWRDLAWRMRSV